MRQVGRLMVAAVTIMVGFSVIRAQSETYKWEGFGGYTYMNLNRGIDPDEVNDEFSDFPGNRVNAHGFNGSVTYNFTRYIGAKFDVTLHSYGEDFTSGLQLSAPPAPPIPSATLKISQNIYQYMGGIQIKDNKIDSQKFKPWAHVLGGIAHENFTVDETSPVAQRLFKVSSDDFAMKLGGGLDWRIHKNVDVRLIQFDWNPIFRSDLNVGGRIGTIGSVLQNNYMFTWGVAIH